MTAGRGAKIAGRVREERRVRTLTQQELADYAGLSKRTVERIESGSENPTLFVLIQIATAMDTTASRLIDDFSADDLPPGTRPHSASHGKRAGHTVGGRGVG